MMDLTSDNKLLAISNSIYTKTNKHISGGCTMSLNGYEPRKGFAVCSNQKLSKTFKSYAEFSNIDVLKFIKKNEKILSRPNTYVGSWWNEKTGEVILDIIITMANMGDALNLGVICNQVYIYDLENETLITVG